MESTDAKVAQLAALNAEADRQITDWSSLFAVLKSTASAYIQEPCKAYADSAALALFSFVVALEDLPDETDPLVFAHKINEVMLMREDLHGARVFVGEEAEKARAAQAEQMAESMRGALANLASVLFAAGASSEEEGPPVDKTRLH